MEEQKGFINKVFDKIEDTTNDITTKISLEGVFKKNATKITYSEKTLGIEHSKNDYGKIDLEKHRIVIYGKHQFASGLVIRDFKGNSYKVKNYNFNEDYQLMFNDKLHSIVVTMIEFE